MNGVGPGPSNGNPREPSIHSRGSLELFDRLSNRSYREGSDGMSVTSSDKLSISSESAVISQMKESYLHTDKQQSPSMKQSNSYPERIWDEHNLPQFPYGKIVTPNQGEHTKKIPDKYHHPPPYREVRMVSGMPPYQPMNHPVLYSRPLHRTQNDPGGYPDPRSGNGYYRNSRPQQFMPNFPGNLQRNGGIFRKVDKETMTDEGEESDTGIILAGNSELTSFYPGHYEAYTGPSFSAYSEPQMANIGAFYGGNQSKGTSTSNLVGNYYPQVTGDLQMFPTAESYQFQAAAGNVTLSNFEMGPSNPGMALLTYERKYVVDHVGFYTACFEYK